MHRLPYGKSIATGLFEVTRTIGGQTITIRGEVHAGTLEQAHLSPLRPWVLALGRLGAALVEALLTALLVGVVLALTLGIPLPFRPAALVPLATTLAADVSRAKDGQHLICADVHERTSTPAPQHSAAQAAAEDAAPTAQGGRRAFERPRERRDGCPVWPSCCVWL